MTGVDLFGIPNGLHGVELDVVIHPRWTSNVALLLLVQSRLPQRSSRSQIAIQIAKGPEELAAR
jgi:hypothetical protein